MMMHSLYDLYGIHADKSPYVFWQHMDALGKSEYMTNHLILKEDRVQHHKKLVILFLPDLNQCIITEMWQHTPKI